MLCQAERRARVRRWRVLGVGATLLGVSGFVAWRWPAPEREAAPSSATSSRGQRPLQMSVRAREPHVIPGGAPTASQDKESARAPVSAEDQFIGVGATPAAVVGASPEPVRAPVDQEPGQPDDPRDFQLPRAE